MLKVKCMLTTFPNEMEMKKDKLECEVCHIHIMSKQFSKESAQKNELENNPQSKFVKISEVFDARTKEHSYLILYYLKSGIC